MRRGSPRDATYLGMTRRLGIGIRHRYRCQPDFVTKGESQNRFAPKDTEKQLCWSAYWWAGWKFRMRAPGPDLKMATAKKMT